MTMLCFDVEDARFNYRVAGIAIHDGQVLLNRFERHDHWFLPGGRVEMGETSTAALQREMQEELAADVQVGRLLWIAESFFDGFEKTYHELALYYVMDFPSEAAVLQATEPLFAIEGDGRVVFQWWPLTDLAQIALYPRFLVEGLRNLPEQTMHVLDSG